MQKTQRFAELEGLRGIAAIMVAFYHYLIAFFAFAFFGAGTVLASVPNKHIETIIHGNPLMVFVSGTFAVAIFFVLSGFVLSIGYFQTGKDTIIKKLAAKRYLRLMLPALASVFFAFFLMSFGLSNAGQASLVTHSGWLASQWAFVPSVFDALRNATWGIFVTGGSGYNNVLWTMMTEFSGSFMVFGSLLLFGRSRYRWVLYASLVVIAFSINIWLMGFVLGMLLADLYASGVITQKVRQLRWMLPFVAVALFLGGYPYTNAEGTIYQFMTLGSYNMLPIYTLAGATIIVAVTISTVQIAKLLAHRYISILGKYTFSLYLVHIPILFSLTTYLFIHLHHYLGYVSSVAASMALSVPFVVAATILFERFVDGPAIRFSARVATIYLGNEPLQLHPRLASIRLVRMIAKKLNTLKPRIIFTEITDQEVID